MLDINGWELIVVLVAALLVIGPERMPEYSAKLAKMVRQVKGLADAARVQLREQMGSEFDDVDWKQYDPRQYDPRRIVREALMDDGSSDSDQSSQGDESGHVDQVSQVKRQSSVSRHVPGRPTPYDEDST